MTLIRLVGIQDKAFHSFRLDIHVERYQVLLHQDSFGSLSLFWLVLACGVTPHLLPEQFRVTLG